MARKVAFFSAILSVSLFSATLGCDEKSATASNFENGLNHFFHAHPECMDVPDLPYTTALQTDSFLPGLKMLAADGVLSETDSINSWGNRVMVFNIAPKGHAFASSTRPSVLGDRATLCYGTKRVEKILNFTEPGEGIQGTRNSTVTYTWTLTNIPDWANKLSEDKFFSKMGIGKEIRGGAPEGNRTSQSEMILTHLGWRVEGDQ